MASIQTQPDERFDAYLDGEMTEAERADYEREMQADPRLRATLKAMRSIEERATAIYRDAPPPRAELLPDEADGASGAPPVAALFVWARRAAIAAALLLVAGLFAVRHNIIAPDGSLPAALVYERVTTDMKPEVVCDTHAKFLAYAEDVYGVSLGADFSAPVEFVGWRGVPNPNSTPNSAPGAGTYTDDGRRLLIARGPSGEPALVMIQLRGLEPVDLWFDGVRVFEKHEAGLSFFEISKGDRPVILPHLRTGRDALRESCDDPADDNPATVN